MAIEIGVRRFGCSIFRELWKGPLSWALVMHLVSVGSSNLQVNQFYQATGTMLSIATVQWEN